MKKSKPRYVIFSDLDSTLLTDKTKKIPLRTVRYIRKLSREGHIFVMASGRPLQAMLKYVKALKINHPVVCDNGGIMYIPDNPKEYTYKYFVENVDAIENTIDKNISKMFLSDLDEIINACFVSGIHANYIQNKALIPFWMVHPDSSIPLLEGKASEILNEDPLMITIYTSDYDKTMEIINKYPHIKHQYWNNPKEGHAFEISKAGTSKGYFIAEVCKMYNVDINNTICFGDQLNDISMFESSNISVAMCTSRAQVLEKAKYQTKCSCNKEGVYKFLKEFFKKSR